MMQKLLSAAEHDRYRDSIRKPMRVHNKVLEPLRAGAIAKKEGNRLPHNSADGQEGQS
jgi:hypothetical protein